MDYKEKYKQALMIAKETYNTQPMYREWLEKMFPELVESEDEKVRKILFEFFKNYKEQDTCGSETFNGIPTDNILAWLKKQGEPSDEEMKTLLRTEYEKGRADAIAEMQGEWSEEDERIMDNLISSLLRISVNTHTDSTSPNYTFYKEIKLLKSLKNRVQPKQEWSEENKDYYDAIIAKLEVTQEDAALTDNQMNFLKSLRPYPQWKPSDEQMKALDFATDCIVPAEFCVKRKVLKELLKQLEKLKEGKV